MIAILSVYIVSFNSTLNPSPSIEESILEIPELDISYNQSNQTAQIMVKDTTNSEPLNLNVFIRRDKSTFPAVISGERRVSQGRWRSKENKSAIDGELQINDTLTVIGPRGNVSSKILNGDQIFVFPGYRPETINVENGTVRGNGVVIATAEIQNNTARKIPIEYGEK